MHILWSTRLGGWLTQSSTYSSEHTQAKQFFEDEALIMCVRQVSQDNEFGLLPVNLNFLESILK